MRGTQSIRPHAGSVQEDWIAWLPAETARVYDAMRADMAVSCTVLGVIVNEALSLSPEAATEPAPQLALLFAALFDRMVRHLGLVLTALEDHGRHCGTLPNAAPLHPEYFRSERARQLARSSQLLSRMPIPGRSVFRPKLSAIRKVISGLQAQTRNLAREIATGESSAARDRWIRLEILQYDLNTCLQETTVVLKSFFCALPAKEVARFRSRLPV